MDILIGGFIVLLILTIAVLWRSISMLRTTNARYRLSLGTSQKQIDIVSSKLSIFTRALPSLQNQLDSPYDPDQWTLFVMDELRALLRGDEITEWRFDSKEQSWVQTRLKKSLRKEQDLSVINGLPWTNLEQVTERHEVMITPRDNNRSQLVVPFLTEGLCHHVYSIVSAENENYTTHDADLAQVFVKQLALMLDYRSMLKNRDKFYLELVQTLADAIDSKDSAGEGKSRKIRGLARGIAEQMNLPEGFITYVEFAALMHDIGNIAIDEQLLKKPGKLTSEEFAMIKKHPEFGYKILAPVSTLAPVAPMVLYHQEWYNGQGYPEGLQGEEIPLGARIVAVLDAWGAMTSDRPWRKALSVVEAIKEIKKGSGSQFDPAVVEAFLATLSKQGLLVH